MFKVAKSDLRQTFARPTTYVTKKYAKKKKLGLSNPSSFLGSIKFNRYRILNRLNEITNLKEGACILFFRPRTRPKTFLQCFALEKRKCKAKHCRNVLGRVLGRKN